MSGEAERDDVQPGDVLALKEGLVDGQQLTSVHVAVLPSRAWVKTGCDGVEIYADTDQATRVLVRKVAR